MMMILGEVFFFFFPFPFRCGLDSTTCRIFMVKSWETETTGFSHEGNGETCPDRYMLLPGRTDFWGSCNGFKNCRPQVSRDMWLVWKGAGHAVARESEANWSKPLGCGILWFLISLYFSRLCSVSMVWAKWRQWYFCLSRVHSSLHVKCKDYIR